MSSYKNKKVDELKQLLGDAGVEIPEDALKDDLVKLADEHLVEEPKDEETKTSEDFEGAVDVIKILNDDSRQYIRTYSKEVHGDNYKALARQCAEASIGFEVVDSASIATVQVVHRVMNKETGINETRYEDYTDKEAALVRAHQVKDGFVKAL